MWIIPSAFSTFISKHKNIKPPNRWFYVKIKASPFPCLKLIILISWIYNKHNFRENFSMQMSISIFAGAFSPKIFQITAEIIKLKKLFLWTRAFPLQWKEDFWWKTLLRKTNRFSPFSSLKRGKSVRYLTVLRSAVMTLQRLKRKSALLQIVPTFQMPYGKRKAESIWAFWWKKRRGAAQKLLPEYYPNEEHANCEIYGIWRRLKDSACTN